MENGERKITDGDDEMFGRYLNAGDFVPGLTKREYFAAMAMQGMVSHPEIGMNEYSNIAEMAIKQANALIKALNA